MYIQSNKQQEDTIINREVILNNFTGKEMKEYKEKKCRFCGHTFQPKAPSHVYCCQDCADNGWSEKYLKRAYSMTFEDWACMYEKTSGRCGICGSRGFKLNPNAFLTLVIDHCHTTGTIRGMLCHNCNRALGLLQDSTESLNKAIEYLGSATTISKESTLK